MYLAYLDESGDSGLLNSPTKWFILSCALVHESHWLSSLDTLVSLRSRLRKKYGITTRPEIKSSDLRRGRGPLMGLGLSQAERMKIFRGLMGYQRLYLPNITVFAVAINKATAGAKGYDPRLLAWDFTLHRIDRFCQGPDERVMLFPDEGHGRFIRRLVRQKRRYGYVPRRWGGGLLRY